MKLRFRRFLWELCKLAGVGALFLFLQNQVIQIRYDLHGNTNGIAEAQSRQSRQFTETASLLRSALEDSQLHFSEARRVFEESSEVLEGERRELARLIDDKTGQIASTLKDRIESERSLLEDAQSRLVNHQEQLRKLERAIDQDSLEMKRRMIYPTVQLRGSGTVGSGVIIYSEPQEEAPGGGRVVSLVLTAHHVVVEVMGNRSGIKVVEEIRVLGENDVFDPEVFSGEVLAGDRDRDLSLLVLRTPRRFPHTVDLASRETLRGLDVFTRAYAVGCPLGNRPLPTAGEISSKSKVVGDQVFWMLSAPTFFGNSGGGVYLAATSQLIGISSMIYTYGKESPTVVPHMGLFVSLESIYDWLDAEGYSFAYRRAPVPSQLLPVVLRKREREAAVAGGAVGVEAPPRSERK